MFNPEPKVFDLEWWLDGQICARQSSTETADGFAFVCTQCFEHRVWAAKYFPNRALIRMYVSCVEHFSERPSEIPGSLILWWAVEELERMPDVLVEREFNVHLAYYLKEKDREFQEPSGDTRKAAIAREVASGVLAELEAGTGILDSAGA